jgi:hypothetical protein
MMTGYLVPILELAEHVVLPVESVETALEYLLSCMREKRESTPELIFVSDNTLSNIVLLELQKKMRTLVMSVQPEVPILFILEEDSLSQEDWNSIDEQIEYIIKPTNISAFPTFFNDLRGTLNRLSRSGLGSLSKNTTLMANLTKEHLPSLLHMLSLVSASGYATLTNPRTKQTGTLHLRYGDITKAILVDPTSSPKRRLEGTEALQFLVDWKEGVFSFGRADPEKMPVGETARWIVLKCGIS